jgi:hypothetical protein
MISRKFEKGKTRGRGKERRETGGDEKKRARGRS